MMKNKLKKDKGLSLVELLVGIAILGILGVGVLSLQYVLTQNQTVVLTTYLAIDEANNAVSTFVREFRSARPGDNGSYTIELANEDQLIFYSDYDFDGDVEKIRYTLQNSTFEKGVIEPQGSPITYPTDTETVKTISENVRNLDIPVFTYYNGNWPEDQTNNPLELPLDISEVRTVGIYLRLNTRGNDPTKDFELKSFSSVRMLKDNL